MVFEQGGSKMELLKTTRFRSPLQNITPAKAEWIAGFVPPRKRRTGQPVTAETFQDSIDFPSTARYVRTILARYDFYKRRGPLLVGDPGSS